MSLLFDSIEKPESTGLTLHDEALLVRLFSEEARTYTELLAVRCAVLSLTSSPLINSTPSYNRLVATTVLDHIVCARFLRRNITLRSGSVVTFCVVAVCVDVLPRLEVRSFHEFEEREN